MITKLPDDLRESSGGSWGGRVKQATILAPQLTRKAHLAYTMMTDVDVRDYDRVKAAIFRPYDISKETYMRCFRSIKPVENERLQWN